MKLGKDRCWPQDERGRLKGVGWGPFHQTNMGCVCGQRVICSVFSGLFEEAASENVSCSCDLAPSLHFSVR